ncbi:MAG: HIT family protein [Candidatus Dadabacteria bacterium]|nr:HIT family protein [Candidatus Dadabacteria bacterium]
MLYNLRSVDWSRSISRQRNHGISAQTSPEFGEVVLIRRLHYHTLTDLPERLIAALFTDTKLIAQSVESGLGAEGTFVAINKRIPQSVAHLHIHIVPGKKKDGHRGFFRPRQNCGSEEEIPRVSTTIRGAIEGLRLNDS